MTPADGVVTAFRDGQVTLRSNRREDGFTNAVEEVGYQGVREGDLVIHAMDGFAGAIGVSDSDGKASPVVHCHLPAAAADARYYAYVLRDLAIRGYITSLAKGIRERSTAFDAETFRSLVLPVPPLVQQRAIADFLDAETARIDAVIEAKRQLVALIEERFALVRRQLILGNLDPMRKRADRQGLQPTCLLGVLLSLQCGHGLPESQRVEGAIPVIASGGVNGWHNAAKCGGPGVITGRYGTVGEVHFCEGPYWPLNTTLYVSDFRGNHPRWVFHLLASLPLDAESEKSAVPGINRNVIGQLRVPRPPLDVQKRVARELDSEAQLAEDVITAISQQLKLLVERRRSVVTAAVSGELRLTGAAA